MARRAATRDRKARASIRALTRRVEALEDRISHPLPTAPPEPDAPGTVQQVLSLKSHWSSVLIEDYPDATITDETGPKTRFYIPGPKSSGTRCELQRTFGTLGSAVFYEWSFMIPSYVTLNTEDDQDNNTICQTHGNKSAGYTGGVSIRPNGEVVGRVKGGHELSLVGSHDYEYENENLVFGEFERDTYHRVRIECHWHDTDGQTRFRLDNEPFVGVSGVPTWPLGDFDGDPTTAILFRLGWYPRLGIVPASGLDMYTTPLKLGVLSV